MRSLGTLSLNMFKPKDYILQNYAYHIKIQQH